MVGIVCFMLHRESAPPETAESIEGLVRDHGGVLAQGPWSYQVAVFWGLIEATNCMRAFQDRFGAALRAGVNLGETIANRDGSPGSGIRFAVHMMERAAPGQVLISAVGGDQITSSMDPDALWSYRQHRLKPVLFLVLQLSALLAYLLGWFYLIYWRVETYSATGAFPRWPKWMCG